MFGVNSFGAPYFAQAFALEGELVIPPEVPPLDRLKGHATVRGLAGGATVRGIAGGATVRGLKGTGEA